MRSEELPSVKEITEGLERLQKELARTRYGRLTGATPKGEELSVYKRYSNILSRDAVRFIKDEARVGPFADHRKRMEATRAVMEHLLDLAMHPHKEALLEALRGEMIRLGKGAIPFPGSEERLTNEPNREIREAVDAARNEIVQKGRPFQEGAISAAHQLAEEHGYSSYVDMWEQLNGFSFSSLLDLLRPLMDETEDIYREILRWWCRRKLRSRAKEVKRHDILHMFRAHEYDRLSAGASIRMVCRRMAGEIGFDLAGISNLLIDEEGEGRSRIPSKCIPAQIPREIILIISDNGGWTCCKDALHSLGEALFYSHVNPGYGFQDRVLGDPSIPLSFALLTEGLMGDELWLHRHLGQPSQKDFIRLISLIRLFLIRRSFARLKYSLILNDGSPLKGKEKIYRDLMISYTGVDYPEAYFLQDWDHTFRSASYLRASILEALWRDHLVRNLCEDWFRQPEAGATLAGIWMDGRRYGPEDLLRAKGLGEMDARPLIDGLCRALAG